MAVAELAAADEAGRGRRARAGPRTTRRYDRGRHSLDRHAPYAVTTWLAEPAGS